MIDRESAYEILGRKVSDINQEKAEEERKEQEMEREERRGEISFQDFVWQKHKNPSGPDGKSPDKRHIYKGCIWNTE